MIFLLFFIILSSYAYSEENIQYSNIYIYENNDIDSYYDEELEKNISNIEIIQEIDALPQQTTENAQIITITNYNETNIFVSNITVTNTIVTNIYIEESVDSNTVITNRITTNIYTTNNSIFDISLATNYNIVEDFFIAIKSGDIDKVLNYLNVGMNPNTRRLPDMTNGITALMCSIANRRIEITKLLISRGADINLTASKKGINNISSLMVAAQSGPIEIVNLLIKNNANINAQTYGRSFGNTALMVAVENDNETIARLLINNGANPNIRTDQGINSLMIAAQKGNLNIVNQLLSLPEIDIYSKDFEGKNILVYAYISGNIQLINLLDKKGVASDVTPEQLKYFIKKYI